METRIYKEIDGSHTFVKKIIMEHYEHISEKDQENFNKIRVYNTIEDPLFNGPDVYYCLKNTMTNINRMYTDLLDDEVLRQQKVESKANITNLITEYGVIHACYLYKTEIAVMFQKFMREVIKQLKTKGVATIIEAHNQLAKNLEEERTKRREAEIVNLQNIHLQEAYCNDFAAGDSANTELKILRRLYLTKYYVYVADWAHVNAKYWKSDLTKIKEPVPQKKITTDKTNSGVVNGIDLNSSDDEESAADKTVSTREKPSKNLILSTPHKDGIQEPYEFEFLKLRDLENSENEEYYFYISNKEITETQKNHFKFITNIYLDKPKHFTEMVKFIVNGEIETNRTAYPVNSYTPTEVSNIDIGDKISTPVKNVYKTTYDMMMSARSRSYIIMNRALLIK